MKRNTKNILIASGLAAASMAASLLILAMSPASAADLGGNCCADLEERIAELEATTARKGNRKVSLRVYGQVNKALLNISGGGDNETFVIENSNAESFVGFAGEAKITQGWSAGYVLEVGVGGYDKALFNSNIGGADNANDIYVRRSFGFIDGPAGKFALGFNSQATDGIAELSVANTTVAARMLSLRPVNGPQIGDALDIFDGTRANVVRYDSPVLAGAALSASWANGSEDIGSTGDVWDVAVRWAGEGSGFRAVAGAGYRKGIVVPTIGAFAQPFGQDVDVWSGSAGLKHLETGFFLNAAYGQFSFGTADVKAYHGQAGVERKWNTLGSTTFYGEYADSTDLDLNIIGAGVVQAIDAAAMDLYLTGRRLDFGGGDDVSLVMGGARVQF